MVQEDGVAAVVFLLLNNLDNGGSIPVNPTTKQ